MRISVHTADAARLPLARRRLWRSWRAHPLLSLAALLVVVVICLPPATLLWQAIQEGSGAWQELWRASTLASLGRTLLLAWAVTLSTTLLALPLAWLTTHTDLPMRRMWAILTSLPLVIPSYIGAYLYASALGPRGMLQDLLQGAFGVQRLPAIYGFPGAFLTLTLLVYPYALLTIRSAWLRIDPSLEEAARSLGLSAWKRFWRVILPALKPAISAGAVLVALYVVRDFGAVAVMRYNAFTRVIYTQYRSAFSLTSAASSSLMLVALVLLILALESRFRGRGDLARTAARQERRAQRVRLGHWRWPALAFCSLIVSLALILPAAVLGYWLLRGLQAGEHLAPLWPAFRNSLLASTLAAILTVAAGLPLAVLGTRGISRFVRALEGLAHIGYALPAVVVALSMVTFGLKVLRPLYQSLAFLLLAYLVLFIPQALGSLRSGLARVHPDLEAAGRSLGQTPRRVFQRITWPLARPGLSAAAALVFLTTMKELPATLILGPTGFPTLATRLWSAVSEAFFAQAAAPALALILASSLPLGMLLYREREIYT